MKKLELVGSFKKDIRRARKRGWDRAKIDAIVTMLRTGEPLPANARPHKLTGDWLGFWECHIGPDWLLIYDASDDTVLLAATGTHSDLFR
ncbi:MAG: type II toxin-antitoxin system YafQ family toxin [Patescibacteria group bacterium]